MLKTQLKWRWARTLVNLKKKSILVLRKLESREKSKMTQIQKLVFDITLKLIHNPDSELRSNNIDYTFHIENENYLIIIRPESGHYSINLIEFKTRQVINNFDVPFDVNDVRVLIEYFDREVHKRMKSKMLMKTTKVAKHLQTILNDIDKKVVEVSD